MELERNKKPTREPSLIPMINIIFLLLIFFMIAGNVEKFEIIPLAPPIAKSGKLLEEGKIVVLMGRYDELIINDEMVDMASFVDTLAGVLKDNPEKVITLKADADIPATNMIAIMDKIKEAGGKNVSLIVQKVGGDA